MHRLRRLLSCCEMRAIRLADGAKVRLMRKLRRAMMKIRCRNSENPWTCSMLSAKKSAEDALPRLLRAQTPGVRQRFGFDSPRIPVGWMLCPCGAGRLNAESFGTPKENARYGINESEDANDNCWNMRRQRQINFCRKNTGRFKLLVRNHAA